MTNVEALIDTIYEAAADPDRWPDALLGLGKVVDGVGAFLVTRHADSWLGWRSAEGLESIGEYIFSSAERHSRATTRLLAFHRVGFVDAHELFGEREYLADPLMTEWGTPRGLHHTIATAIPMPTGDIAIVQVNRRKGQPRFGLDEFSTLDALRPHLARAGLMAVRWRLERLRAATDALASIGLPAAILDVDGKVLAANDLIQSLRSHVIWASRDRIAFVDPEAGARFRRAFDKKGGSAAARAGSFPARSASAAPCVVHLMPTVGMARDIFDGGVTLLAMTPIAAPKTLDIATLSELFDLTPAEAHVAIAVTEGFTLREIAARRGVAVETVRTQIKSLFAKAGVTRQSRLAALLAAQRPMPLE